MLKKMLLAAFAVFLFAPLAHATPRWFNGNFLAKNLTNADYKSIQAQMIRYETAKATHDLKGELDNSFWTSVQAWAYMNAGKRAGNAQDLKLALKDFKAGKAVLDNVDTSSTVPEREEVQEEKASNAIRILLLYTERCAGILVMPDGSLQKTAF